jgi:hypothetical protein
VPGANFPEKIFENGWLSVYCVGRKERRRCGFCRLINKNEEMRQFCLVWAGRKMRYREKVLTMLFFFVNVPGFCEKQYIGFA